MTMRIALTAVLLVTALHAAASSLSDITRSMRERTWEAEYIPESGDSIPPLTEYEEYEVVELLRAETIEELEAALPETYPMPWLEETLQDTSIPWEDRYWLDRRVRAAISQNLHVFYDTEGNPVHVDADGIFPGEFYWREHMIADPEGWNVPEGAERPVGLEEWDIGHLYNAYGERVGEIAVPVPRVIFLDREASIGVIASGGNGIYNPRNQPYACLMYPDGSFMEIPLDSIGAYDGMVSADGEVIAFFCVERFHLPSEERATSIVPIYLFDREGNTRGTITPVVPPRWQDRAAISADGRYACHAARGANALLVDFREGVTQVLPKPEEYERYTYKYYFSPDCEYLCLGGSTTGRIINLEDGSYRIFPETIPSDGGGHQNTKTMIRCSNNQGCTSLSISSEEQSLLQYKMIVYMGDRQIWSSRRTMSERSFGLEVDVSPNGNYLIVNPPYAAHGVPSESAGIRPGAYNLPFAALRIEGR